MQQLELSFRKPATRTTALAADWLTIGCRQIRLQLVPNRRARRYVLRLRTDEVARVTVPRRGSLAEARKFAQRNVPWLEKQLLRRAANPPVSRTWPPGSESLFRGQKVRIETGLNGGAGHLRFGDQEVRIKHAEGDLRPAVEHHLWNLAARELPPRVFALATQHRLPVGRVSVRNQKSRWGSCSRHGTICLNWRLLQAPESVRDYIILHELAHLKEMNHSRQFWKEVARLCPDYQQAEAWLKKHAALLR